MKKDKLVIFDFDGVLVNTSDLIYSIFDSQNPHLTKEFFVQMHDGNFHERVKDAVEKHGYQPADKYHERYSAGLLELTTEDVVRKLIIDLYKKYNLAIVSSTRGDSIVKKLEKENIREYFSDVLGMDSHLSKVVKIQSLLEKFSLSSEEVIFVTDTLGDIKEGNECGVASIGVTWGMHDRKTLEKGEPYYYCRFCC